LSAPKQFGEIIHVSPYAGGRDVLNPGE